MFARSRLFVLVVVVLLPLAGCMKKSEAPPVPTVDIDAARAHNATLPDGRGESAGLAETNNTEAGVGGIEHRHDYWKNQTRVVLFDDAVSLFCPPCLPDGEGSQPKSVAYVKLGRLADDSGDALVYEGAEKVEILLGAPTLFGVVPHPAPPAIFLQYRSAADVEWTTPASVTFDSPMVIDVTPLMTDMPHSSHSLWVFRLTTDRPEVDLSVPMTVTVVKGREVVDWPGHPDFYADKHERVVMQQHVTTHMGGAEDLMYGSAGSWVHPERLISWGTKEIHIFINITDAKNAYGASATGFFLEALNATYIGPEVSFGSRHSDIYGNDDLKSYEFALNVNEAGMDGPYQPASRWSFRAMATYATLPENPVANGLCPGCFPYDIEYDITVIAMDHSDDLGDDMSDVV